MTIGAGFGSIGATVELEWVGIDDFIVLEKWEGPGRGGATPTPAHRPLGPRPRAGKRVACLGTGASARQLIPEITAGEPNLTCTSGGRSGWPRSCTTRSGSWSALYFWRIEATTKHAVRVIAEAGHRGGTTGKIRKGPGPL